MMSVKSNLEASVQIQSLLGALHDLEPVIFFFYSFHESNSKHIVKPNISWARECN